MIRLFSLIALFVIAATPAQAGKVLFYMHGSDMHGKSADHKNVKNYNSVVKHLQSQGLEVVFEVRTERDADAESDRTAQMVRDRIAAGTKPQDIIIAGYSYGSMMALKTAAKVGLDTVNVALFCGCPESPSVPVSIPFEDVKGRVLSIIDTDDAKFGSCKGRLPNVSNFTEQTITSGKGHKIFKLGKGKFLKAWAPLFVDWAS